MRRNDSGELLDKNGLTEREFLAAYRADRYPRPVGHGGYHAAF